MIPVVVGAVLALVLGVVLGRVTVDADPAQGARPSAVDIGFSQDMGIHHDQAVVMASLANDRGGVAVRAVAASILGGQSQESGAMRGWLAAWGAPATSDTPMAWMAERHVDHASAGHGPTGLETSAGSGVTMPGMASAQELTDLWASSGDQFDVAFLELMIRHHQGGVAMAADAAEHGTLDLVRSSAAAKRSHQAQEIGLMRALLAAHRDSPEPPR